MSRTLQAAFLRHLRHTIENNFKSSNGTAADLVETARGLAATWIDDRWRGPLPSEHQTNESVYPNPPLPNEALEANLREFWHVVILAAKSSKCAGRRQLVVDVIDEKKNGVQTLKRPIPPSAQIGGPNSTEMEIASTSDGVVWADLPYFRSELFDAFLSAPPLSSTEEWTNLHAFAALVTSSNLRDLTFYCLWAVFDALEVNEMYPVPSPGSDQPAFPVVVRFDPVLIWFQLCGKLIFRGCLTEVVPVSQCNDTYSCRWNGDGPEFVGRLAVEAGVQTPGFSMKRWHFWRSRLECIRDESRLHTNLKSYNTISIEILDLMDVCEGLEHNK